MLPVRLKALYQPAISRQNIPLTEYSTEDIFATCGKLNTRMSSRSGGQA